MLLLPAVESLFAEVSPLLLNLSGAGRRCLLLVVSSSLRSRKKESSPRCCLSKQEQGRRSHRLVMSLISEGKGGVIAS